MNNDTILMICYYYPPLTDVGCKRSISFSTYLKQYGWKPYVLSVKNPDKTYCSMGNELPPKGIHAEYSYSLINPYRILGKLNGGLSRIFSLFKVHIKRNYFYDVFCIPDPFWGWIPLTIFKAQKLVNKFNISVIYVSCPPFSSALIGVMLKWKTKKPLVLDFRDPFAIEPNMSNAGIPRFRKKVNTSIQHLLIKHTNILILNNEDTKRIYAEQYPISKNKMHVIHNGFEQEWLQVVKGTKYSKFTVVYTGDFYLYSIQSNIFFEALALLKSRKLINKHSFQFLFFGDEKNEISKIAVSYGVDDLVAVSSRVSYETIMKVISSSHLQLLRIVKPCLSTKLFEGIPLNIPFLATIPPGEAEQIIMRYSPCSYIITDESPEKVANAITDAMTKCTDGRANTNRVHEFLEQFSREKLAMKLIHLIEQI